MLKTKEQRLRDLIKEGKTPKEIIEIVPNTKDYDVYNLKWRMKKAAKATALHMLQNKKKRGAKRVIKSFISARSTKAMKVVLKKYAATTDATPAPAPALTPNQIQIGGEHYKKMDIQPWDAIHSWDLGFFSGNAVKYIARHRDKGGVEDLKKARHYLDKLISFTEKNK